MKQRLLIIFGGQSTEHDISRISAAAIIGHADTKKYEIFTLGITKDGRWLLYEGPHEYIADGQWERRRECRPAFISPDRIAGGLHVREADGSYSKIAVDVVFPVLHGKKGEDGTVQGLFELAGLPYVGVGVTSSALCMDKAFAKHIAQSAHLPQTKWLLVLGHDFRNNPAKTRRKIEEHLTYPLFVKPANFGSSVGINKACDTASLERALALACELDNRIVVEEGVDAREIEVAVLGNRTPIASGCGEIAPSGDFYDYNAKYVDDKSVLYIPASLPCETAERVRALATSAYTLMGCEGMARVDFFVLRANGEVLLNEINTIPGFTAISMYPKLFDACGIPLNQLIDRLVGLALERFEEGCRHG